MKKIFLLLGIIIILIGLFLEFNKKTNIEQVVAVNVQPAVNTSPVKIIPITHATAILNWKDTIIYIDPIGGAEAYLGMPEPDFILVTDIHGDHLSTTTLTAVIGSTTTLIAPKAVKDLLPPQLAARVEVLNNDEGITIDGFEITALPMYNLPVLQDSIHVRGRGNGYLLTKEGFDVYIAGDTAGIPEMRELTGIDIAFIPMNLPFTMGVEEAADAVLDFEPKRVYPYHYRGQDGLTNINKFKQLVDAGNKNIEVILLDWYSQK